MDKWYVIGQGSSFDSDMDYSEIAIDFFNRGDSNDIKVYYNFFKSKAIKYFSEFVDFYNVEDIDDYLTNSTSYDVENMSSNFVIHFDAFKQKYSIEDIQTRFDEYMENWSFEYSSVEDYLETSDFNDLSENKKIRAMRSFEDSKYRATKRFILLIVQTFDFLSKILCFLDIERRDMSTQAILRLNLGGKLSIIANHTGWFAFNSYMFALVNNVYLLGVPSGISTYDSIVECPYYFFSHDLNHTDDIIDAYGRPDQMEKILTIYENIHKGDYIKQEKEVLIFSLWYHVHESVQRVDSTVVYPNSFAIADDEFHNYLDVFDYINPKIRKDILNNFEAIYGWLDKINRTVDVSRSDIPRFLNNITLKVTTSDILKFLQNDTDSGVVESNEEDLETWRTDPRKLRVYVMIWYGYYQISSMMSSLK